MNTYKSILINFLLLLVIIYFPFAFVSWKWNPIDWHITVRALYILTLIAVMTYGAKEFKK